MYNIILKLEHQSHPHYYYCQLISQHNILKTPETNFYRIPNLTIRTTSTVKHTLKTSNPGAMPSTQPLRDIWTAIQASPGKSPPISKNPALSTPHAHDPPKSVCTTIFLQTKTSNALLNRNRGYRSLGTWATETSLSIQSILAMATSTRSNIFNSHIWIREIRQMGRCSFYQKLICVKRGRGGPT